MTFRVARWPIDLTVLLGATIHFLAYLRSIGGWDAFVREWESRSLTQNLLGAVIFFGLILLPYIVLVFARFLSSSLKSAVVTLLGAFSVVCIDIWMYRTPSSSSELGWAVILVPIVIQLPVALFALVLALAMRPARKIVAESQLTNDNRT